MAQGIKQGILAVFLVSWPNMKGKDVAKEGAD